MWSHGSALHMVATSFGHLERLLWKLGRGGMEEDTRSWSLAWILVTEL